MNLDIFENKKNFPLFSNKSVSKIIIIVFTCLNEGAKTMENTIVSLWSPLWGQILRIYTFGARIQCYMCRERQKWICFQIWMGPKTQDSTSCFGRWLAWKNSWLFATPPLVSWWNDIWETSTEIHTDDMSLPRSG